MFIHVRHTFSNDSTKTRPACSDLVDESMGFSICLSCSDLRPLFGTSPVRIGSLEGKVARRPTLQTFPYLGRSVVGCIKWLFYVYTWAGISFLISTSVSRCLASFQYGTPNHCFFSWWIFQDDIPQADNRKFVRLDHGISGRPSFRILIVLPAVVYHALSRNVETTLRHKWDKKCLISQAWFLGLGSMGCSDFVAPSYKHRQIWYLVQSSKCHWFCSLT